MREFLKQWTCVEAIQKLFFAHFGEFMADTKKGKALQEVIQLAWADIPISRMILTQQEHEKAVSAVREIKKSMPGFEANTALHAMLWVRWALNTPDLSLCHDFVRKLCTWLAKPRTDEILLAQYTEREKVSTQKRTWSGLSKKRGVSGEQIGYTLEEVLKLKTLPAGKGSTRKKHTMDDAPINVSATTIPKEYALQWRVKTVQFRRLKTSSRTTKQVCGSAVMAVLIESVETEARSGSTLLQARRKNGKFISLVPRDDLISSLRDKFPRLKRYEDTTIKRALPSIVTSPRGRRGGFPSN
jgi:hypothetical protein